MDLEEDFCLAVSGGQGLKGLEGSGRKRCRGWERTDVAETLTRNEIKRIWAIRRYAQNAEIWWHSRSRMCFKRSHAHFQITVQWPSGHSNMTDTSRWAARQTARATRPKGRCIEIEELVHMWTWCCSALRLADDSCPCLLVLMISKASLRIESYYSF